MQTQSSALSEVKQKQRGEVLVGVIAGLMGLFIVLVGSGLIAPRPLRPHEGPPWILVLIGTMFMFGGAALVIARFRGESATHIGDLPRSASRARWVVHFAFGVFMIGSFAVIGSWVAFGPGERAFSMTLPLIGKGPANDMLGRAVFGIGAVIMWIVLVAAAVTSWRRLFGTGDITLDQ